MGKEKMLRKSSAKFLFRKFLNKWAQGKCDFVKVKEIRLTVLSVNIEPVQQLI